MIYSNGPAQVMDMRNDPSRDIWASCPSVKTTDHAGGAVGLPLGSSTFCLEKQPYSDVAES